MFTVYVIYNKEHKKIYIGQTVDLEKRIKDHNDPNDITHKYTRKFGGKWELIHKEEFGSRLEALKREKQLKSYQGRKFLKTKYIPL